MSSVLLANWNNHRNRLILTTVDCGNSIFICRACLFPSFSPLPLFLWLLDHLYLIDAGEAQSEAASSIGVCLCACTRGIYVLAWCFRRGDFFQLIGRIRIWESFIHKKHTRTQRTLACICRNIAFTHSWLQYYFQVGLERVRFAAVTVRIKSSIHLTFAKCIGTVVHEIEVSESGKVSKLNLLSYKFRCHSSRGWYNTIDIEKNLPPSHRAIPSVSQPFMPSRSLCSCVVVNSDLSDTQEDFMSLVKQWKI